MELKKEIEFLLNHPTTREIEAIIAENIGCSIYDHPLLIDSDVQCILNSEFTVSEINAFMQLNKGLIIEYAVKILNRNLPVKNIARGASIIYSIYLLYITTMPDKLSNFINKMKIPKSKKVVLELMNLYKTLG